MKTRIVSSVALAAIIALGASGCSLIAHQGTAHPYAPSDGIDVNADAVDVRNLMFIVDEKAGIVNTVFTAVNGSAEAQALTMTVVTSDNQQTVLNFLLEPGTTTFGDPSSTTGVALVKDDQARAGGLATVYLQSGTSTDIQREVPVLDGTLPEYADYVVTAAMAAQLIEDAEKVADKAADVQGIEVETPGEDGEAPVAE